MSSNKIKSVDLALEILEYLKDNDDVDVDELVAEFNVSSSSIHRHLTTLKSHGYVAPEEDSYSIGLRFIEMAHHAKNRKKEYEVAEQITETLASQTGDRAAYVAEENGLGVVMASETGEHGILADLTIGQRVHLHASSVGKAILANLSRSQVESIINRHGLPRVTDDTITDTETLMKELDETRNRGYSINRSERVKGLHAVGVAVENEHGTVVGAFSVSGPTRRLTDDRISGEISSTLLNAAEEFELRNRHVE